MGWDPFPETATSTSVCGSAKVNPSHNRQSTGRLGERNSTAQPQTASDTNPQASSKSLVGKRENEDRTKR